MSLAMSQPLTSRVALPKEYDGIWMRRRMLPTKQAPQEVVKA